MIRIIFDYLIVTVVIAVLSIVGGCGEKIDGVLLADKGHSDYRIVISKTASPSVAYGAFELQRFLYEISGAVIPIVTDAMPLREKEILLGPSRHLSKLDAPVDMAALGDEGYILRTSGRHLIIAGSAKRGALYGVYGLLEDHLGCRWFTSEVSRIPKRERLVIENLDETVKPVFEYREPYVWEAFDGDWAARNRMNRNSKDGGLTTRHGGRIEWVPGMFAHTFAKLVPPSEYARSHPEYFSLVNGRRKASHSQLCCTNENVVRIVTEGVLEAFRTNPQAQVLSVSQNDWDYHCECQRCQALAEKEESQMAPVLYLVNRVAQAVEREYPGKLVETLAYQWTRKPPKSMRPEPNVVIRLCTIECCFSHPLASCTSEENRAFAEDIRGWSNVSNRLWIWNYCTSFAHYFAPYPNLKIRGEDMRFFADNNVTSVFQQDVYTTPNGELSGLSAYLNAKLLWNPQYDTSQAIDDYTGCVYGPAAGQVRAYIDLIHESVEQNNIHMGIWQGPEAEYLDGGVLASADSLWNEAERAAASSPHELERVRIDRLSVDYAVLCRGMTRGTAYIIDNDSLSLAVDPSYTARLDRFCDTAKKAGIRRLKEYNYSVDEFRADVEKTVKPRKLAMKTPPSKHGDKPGTAWRYYRGKWKKPPNFGRFKPSAAGVSETIRLPFPPPEDVTEDEACGYVFSGYVTAPKDGVYAFSTKSDGFSKLTVGGGQVVYNGGIDPYREKCGFIALKAGVYPIEAVFFTREKGKRLSVFISGPDMEKREIGSGLLTH